MPHPETDDQIEDLDSSTSSNLDDNLEGSQPQGEPEGGEAGSSPATGDNDDSHLLNVVRDAVPEHIEPKEASPADVENDGQPADDKQPKQLDDENYTDVPFNKHPRFRQVLGRLKAAEQDAGNFRNIQNFISEQGLNNEEVADGMIIMGLMKQNPVEAWKRLKPTIQNLLVAAGEVLPQDLQQMVTAGQMDPAAALEVSRARAGVNASQAQQSFAQQRTARQQQAMAAEALSGAANDWEAQRRQRDPNFDGKMVPLQKEILFLQQTEGRPTTPQGVREQLEKAYKAVNESFRAPAPGQPRKREMKPVTGGQVAGNQRPANMSTLDIVRANRRQ